jgi:hypothetical protein
MQTLKLKAICYLHSFTKKAMQNDQKYIIIKCKNDAPSKKDTKIGQIFLLN